MLCLWMGILGGCNFRVIFGGIFGVSILDLLGGRLVLCQHCICVHIAFCLLG